LDRIKDEHNSEITDQLSGQTPAFLSLVASLALHLTFREYAKLLRPLVGLIKAGKSITYFFQILSKKQFGWSEAQPHIRCYVKYQKKGGCRKIIMHFHY